MSQETLPSGLIIEDLVIGEGKEARGEGFFLTVHYTGWLEDGSQFDSSVDRDEPFRFPLDCGFVIPAWDQGVVGMRVGGKRKLIAPPAMAYGSQGAGGIIPPNATLTFEIELLDVSE